MSHLKEMIAGLLASMQGVVRVNDSQLRELKRRFHNVCEDFIQTDDEGDEDDEEDGFINDEAESGSESESESDSEEEDQDDEDDQDDEEDEDDEDDEVVEIPTKKRKMYIILSDSEDSEDSEDDA